MKGIHRRAPKRGPIVARRGIALGLALTLFMAGIALADELLVEGDGLAPFTGSNMALGTICVGSQRSGEALLAIERKTGAVDKIFADLSTVTISSGVPSSASVSTVFVDSAITMPSGWAGSKADVVNTTDMAQARVQVVAAGSPGTRSATIVYTATGINSSTPPSALVRSVTLTVEWIVSVCDSTPPVIVPTVTGTLGLAGWYTGNAGLTWSVTDAQSAISSTTGCGASTVSTDTAGVTFTCSATSSGGTSTQSVTIKRDATAPVLTLPSLLPIEATGPTGAIVTYSASANDALTGPVGTSCSKASGSVFALGSTSVTCFASDPAGNEVSDSFTAKVEDTTAPALALPSNQTAEATGSGGAAVAFTATASDLVDGAVAVQCAPASGSTFALGTTTVNCSAEDAAGNLATGSFTVTVVDTTPPAMTMPSDILLRPTSGSSAMATFAPTASDLVSGNVTVTCDRISGSTFGMGATTVKCSAMDTAGNMGIGEFKVTVAYLLDGFYRPIDNVFANSVKAGSAVPVKFSLTGNQGLNVFAAGYPLSAQVACPSVVIPDLEEMSLPTDSNSGLSYDVISDQYNYVWKTSKAFTGCRELRVKFVDGTIKKALFKFNK